MKTLNLSHKECPYEVGDILQTKNSTNPATRWPGTKWQAIETFLLGVSENHSIGETGGEETHTLTTAEMPKHNHSMWTYLYQPSSSITQMTNDGDVTTEYAVHWTDSAGDDQPHNNMPPYTAVYTWERIA